MKAAEQAIAMAESAGEFSAKHTFDHAVETALSEIESMVEGLVPAENSRWFAVKLFERDEKVLDSLSLAQNLKLRLEDIISELEKKEDELLAQAKELEQTLKNMVDVNSEYVGGVFTWPVPSSHYITSYAGYRMHPVYNVWKYHSGMDIAASYGADIVAMGDGKVILSQYYGGYGNCVMIDHGGGIVSLYGHASSLCVSVGQSVKKGQVIAKVGSTGTSTGNHLHVEVRENGAIVDPLNYLKG